jgi:hypothetical protein
MRNRNASIWSNPKDLPHWWGQKEIYEHFICKIIRSSSKGVDIQERKDNINCILEKQIWGMKGRLNGPKYRRIARFYDNSHNISGPITINLSVLRIYAYH